MSVMLTVQQKAKEQRAAADGERNSRPGHSKHRKSKRLDKEVNFPHIGLVNTVVH